MQKLFRRLQGLALMGFVLSSWQLVFGQCLTVGSSTVLPDPGVPIYPGFPDGHITFLKMNDQTLVQIWAGYESYITSGPSAFQQDSVWGCKLSKGEVSDFDNGGAWLYSVFKIDSNTWVGFYHAEDHVFPGYSNDQKIAWKSAAQCVSYDGGNSWVKNGQIITSWLKKTTKPEWGGTGDFSVVRDSARNRWVAFFVCPDGIGMAESFDALGGPGTWKKYHKGSFSENGIGGEGSALSVTKGKNSGGNPSIIFHKQTNKWIMVYHDWNEKGIYYTTSSDLEHWDNVQLMLVNPGSPQKIWYPTLFSEKGDNVSDGDLFLAYAQWDDVNLPYRNYRIAPVYFSSLSAPIVDPLAQLTYSNLVLSDTLNVNLKLYDVFGNCLTTFYENEFLTPNTYKINVGPFLTQGIAILRLEIEGRFQEIKVVKY